MKYGVVLVLVELATVQSLMETWLAVIYSCSTDRTSLKCPHKSVNLASDLCQLCPHILPAVVVCLASYDSSQTGDVQPQLPGLGNHCEIGVYWS